MYLCHIVIYLPTDALPRHISENSRQEERRRGRSWPETGTKNVAGVYFDFSKASDTMNGIKHDQTIMSYHSDRNVEPESALSDSGECDKKQ